MDQAVRRRRRALFLLFLLAGITMSSWVTRTPAIRVPRRGRLLRHMTLRTARRSHAPNADPYPAEIHQKPPNEGGVRTDGSPVVYSGQRGRRR